ncbi:hypothetical protein EDB92DRAFT_1864788 [Lactarius akahatsu]|uniref:Uncharacterized protein n=1 Tax=Lactarius akahatsu TaxID=416441 RepID=A0AAD4LG76_9AGAM|nr:hypothetical protein EDB92DRAFT_1864788 [Lactarius akahatsu]
MTCAVAVAVVVTPHASAAGEVLLGLGEPCARYQHQLHCHHRWRVKQRCLWRWSHLKFGSHAWCWWLFDESCAMVAAILDLVFGVPLSNTSDCFCGSDGSNVMAAVHQHAPLAGIVIGISSFNLRFGSPALAEVPNGLSLAQLVQLDGIDGRMNSV